MKRIAMALGLTFAAVGPVCGEGHALIPYANTIEITAEDTESDIVAKSAHVVPTPQQMQALEREFIGFVHIGPNTFTRREWGTGLEDAAVFDLKTLDTDQWVKAMKDAGMKMVILTVKHHDGYVLWQSRYTRHGIMSSGFEGGKGDILRSLSQSCARHGMKLGVYLSPADLYQIERRDGLYGNGSKATGRVIPRPVEGREFADKRTFKFEVDDYNEYFLNQLFELLTEYGPIHEVWFDGAHPKRKGGQTYNNRAWREMIRELAPEAVIFGRQDVRWCGNEAGDTRAVERNVLPFTANPDTMGYFPDMTAEELGLRSNLQGAKFLHYIQPEIDTSIREGWFYRDEDTQRSRSADELFDIYERSVGGNGTFLLNVPPNREGRFSDRDVAALAEVGRRIRATYDKDLFDGAWRCDSFVDIDMKADKAEEMPKIGVSKPVKINRVVLQEPIARRGERIEEMNLEAFVDGKWKVIAHAGNVGYKRILRFPAVTTDSLRLDILSSRLDPALSRFTAHYCEESLPALSVICDGDGSIDIGRARSEFGWKVSGTLPKMPAGAVIRYTTDGSDPVAASAVYDRTIIIKEPCVVKASAWIGDRHGPAATEQIGYPRSLLRAMSAKSNWYDGNLTSVFATTVSEPCPHLTMTWNDGVARSINGVAYTPDKSLDEHRVSKALIQRSDDGCRWTDVEVVEYGNIVNDPSTRYHRFANPVVSRYIRFVPLEVASVDGQKKSDIGAVAELMWY